MAARVVLLALLYSSRGAMWIVEQPQGSLLEYHPRFQWLLGKMPVFKVCVRMGEFGAGTEKATWLYSNRQEVARLEDYRLRRWASSMSSGSLVNRFVDDSGTQRCRGNSALKASQAYPRAFGEACTNLFAAVRCSLVHEYAELKSKVCDSTVDGAGVARVLNGEPGDDDWDDAKMRACSYRPLTAVDLRWRWQSFSLSDVWRRVLGRDWLIPTKWPGSQADTWFLQQAEVLEMPGVSPR